MFAFVQVMAVRPVRDVCPKHGVRGLNRDFPGISPVLSQRKKAPLGTPHSAHPAGL